MPQRLPRFFRRQEELEDKRRLAEILIETGETAPPPIGSGAAGGDWKRLRGLPALGPHVRGVIPGSDPVQALLHKENSTAVAARNLVIHRADAAALLRNGLTDTPPPRCANTALPHSGQRRPLAICRRWLKMCLDFGAVRGDAAAPPDAATRIPRSPRSAGP